MATAAVQHSFTHEGLDTVKQPQLQPQIDQKTASKSSGKKDVVVELKFYKANEDGSPPHPTYIDRPETYERPYESHDVTIHDVRGDEQKYSLDKQGFQIYPHVSVEKDFINDEQIKAQYYPETEQLLKDAYV
jgi:hypothetical protein